MHRDGRGLRSWVDAFGVSAQPLPIANFGDPAYGTADAEFIAHARMDVPRLVAGYEEMHESADRPTSDHHDCDPGECDRAGEGELLPSCRECRTWAPCPTVRAITDTLTKED